MQEDENKSQVVTEEADDKPTRDEILARSRAENRHGDERDNHIYKSAIQIAYSIGLILTGIIMLVSSILGELPAELMIVYMGMTGTMGLYCGIRFTKRKPLFIACGVICLIASAFFTVYWILQLCGVM